MYSISAATLAYLRACKPCGLSIAVAGVGGNTTLTEENILLGSFEYDISGSSGNVIGLGAAPTGQVSFAIDNHDGAFSAFVFEGAVLTIQITTGGNDNIPLGKFIVDVQPKSLSTIEIVALDYMAKFYKEYDTDLTFPASLATIAADACTKCGVVNALPTLPNGTYIVSEKPTDTTYHEVLSAVAQLNGMFARIDRAGQLKMGWYVDEGADILISDRFELSSLAETDISITGIRVKTKDYEYLSGTSAYALVVENNILLANNEDDVEDFALSLLTAVGGFTYRPFRSIVKGLPHYEFGDILNPYTDPDSTSLVSIITDMRYLLRGTMTLEAVGEPEIRRGYATTAPFTAQQRAAVETAAETVANVVVSPYAQQLIYLNERAANSFGLFQTGVEQLDGSYIYYWHDSATLEGSSFISMFTETGYYWTNDGWNSGSPVWNFGFTSDGDALFRYLSVKGLHADWMTTGRLSSVDGNTYFDLDTGIINTPGVIYAAGFSGTGASSQVLEMRITGDFLAFKYDTDNLFAAYRELLDPAFPTYAQYYTDFNAMQFWIRTDAYTQEVVMHLGKRGIGVSPSVTQVDGLWSLKNFLPWTDATYDLGSSSYKWKDGYFSGNLNIGGTIRSDVTAGTYRNVLYGMIAINDFYRIRVGGASNAGALEIATADDGNEPIYVRQYTGEFATVANSATILDENGNTSFPGNLASGKSQYRAIIGSASFTWGGSGAVFPTIYSDHADRWIMLCQPHIPFLKNGVNGYTGTTAGSNITFGSDTSSIHSWRVGVGFAAATMYEDEFAIVRNNTWIMKINNTDRIDLNSYRLRIVKNVGTSAGYSDGQLELHSTDGSDCVLGFHRGGLSACALIHEGNGLRLSNTTHDGLAQFSAGNIYQNGVQVSNVNHGHSYLPLSGGTLSGSVNPPYDGGVHFGGYNNRFASFNALAFNNASQRELKDEIVEYASSSAYDEIKKLPTYSYKHKKKEKDEDAEQQTILGVMVDESPVCITNATDEHEATSINLYSYSTFILAGLKEAIAKIEKLEAEVAILKTRK